VRLIIWTDPRVPSVLGGEKVMSGGSKLELELAPTHFVLDLRHCAHCENSEPVSVHGKSFSFHSKLLKTCFVTVQ
jgi:hypothetical protein